MTDDMTKRRNELADKRSRRQCSSGNPDLDRAISWYLKIGFEDGFDAGVAEMQAQVDGLMKSNKEMSDLIYSEDGYIASQDSLVQERDTLKQQLEIAVKALEFYGDGQNWSCVNNNHPITYDRLQYDQDLGKGDYQITEQTDDDSVSGLRARQALTQIKELQGSSTTTAEPKGVK